MKKDKHVCLLFSSVIPSEQKMSSNYTIDVKKLYMTSKTCLIIGQSVDRFVFVDDLHAGVVWRRDVIQRMSSAVLYLLSGSPHAAASAL